MKAALNHIGIAVQDLETLRRLFELLGLTVDHSEHVADQKVMTHFIPLPVKPGHLEFLEPTDPESAVAKFMQKRGPGIHHLSFLLPDGELDTITARLNAAGYRLIYDSPRPGAQGM